MTKMKPEELIKKAGDLIKKRYNPDFHEHHTVVAACVLSKSGKVYTAVNAGTYQPSIATCAEIIAIGMGNTAEKDFEIDTIVALRDVPPYPISPCGKSSSGYHNNKEKHEKHTGIGDCRDRHRVWSEGGLPGRLHRPWRDIQLRCRRCACDVWQVVHQRRVSAGRWGDD